MALRSDEGCSVTQILDFLRIRQYSILAENESARSDLMDNMLKKAGIPTAIYYPQPLHLQPAFVGLACKNGDFPVSEDCSTRIFSLPMHPYLSDTDQERITEILLNENDSKKAF